MSDITKADDIELEEIAENALRSIENLTQQVQEEPTDDLPMRELLGLEKQLRSIRSSLHSLQITSFREMIAKVLDSDTSLAEKIRMLSREQGITIASILTAIRMAISVLVEAMMPGGGGGGGGGGTAVGGEPPPKDEKGLKERIRSKLIALASLLGKFGVKAAEALPGIIGAIISWVLNKATDVVGWVLQHLWALVVGIGGLIYTYMVTK